MRVAEGDYVSLFDEVWGAGAFDCENNVSTVYDQIGLSIAAFERSAEVNPFSSKYAQVMFDNPVLFIKHFAYSCNWLITFPLSSGL